MVPRITIVTVTKNAALDLEKTIQSVISQTFKNIEYIVIDGKSSDNTNSVLKKYSPQISYSVSEEDGGLYYAMNKGLKAAHGDFILFLNAGDLFINQNVLEVISAQIINKNTLYFGNALITNGKITWNVPPRDADIGRWLKKGYPNHQTIFYPKKFYKQESYDTSFSYYADTDYTLRAMTTFNYEYLNIDMVYFRLGGLSNNIIKFSSVIRHMKESLRLHHKYIGKFGRLFYLTIPFRYMIKYFLNMLLPQQFYYQILKFKNSLKKSG